MGTQTENAPELEETEDWLFFDERNSFLETEFANLTANHPISTFFIHETENGFYVTVLAKGKDELFLATRRDRHRPRMFRNYERMSRALKQWAVDANKIILYE